MLELLTLTLCLTLLFGLVFYFLLQSLFGVPYVPSMGKGLRETLLQLNLQGKKFVDLGSGDGKMVIMAARMGANAYGVEINPALVIFSWMRAFMFGIKNAKFRRTSFNKFAVGDFDVVFVYLLPSALEKLLPKFESEMKPGSIIVSNTFKFPQREPDQTLNGQFHIYHF